MINLNKKVAIVTGGSRGIGKAIVTFFAEAGANVAFTYNSRKNYAEKLCSDLKKKTKVKSYKVNIISEQEVKSAVAKVRKEFGRVDILVNNAGIWKRAQVDKMSFDDWNETIQTNLTGAFLFTKYVVPIMKKNKFGRIINITSTAGQRGEAFYSHYAASKGGLIAFTKSLAVELGRFNITVNDVAPGWVKTDMTKSVFKKNENEEEILMEIPLRKVAVPKDIAGAVCFLASDLASHITGSTISVNGGSVL